ncbi:hypothetical protein Celf_0093 [Cellulomonas fimi ATCC 484]|uniref:Uncharacterized protein n=1 Tax=Cellulomonas fimi (strain ATCC 484 / DSM 20113 / JCM 1341 / CCUG 24087 / LMG 16345 / NBRC 15513 / NCIMB 8980 / NCTC 7547 / NRS-133) TaxID=590998 RepID=F4H4P2_CELFA|nr:hypothetical protein Celf_0093 [Cellulomonas fimi ATCC 484]VEH25956.1 Uncharacterised protein [Cellulomonas fimi]
MNVPAPRRRLALLGAGAVLLMTAAAAGLLWQRSVHAHDGFVDDAAVEQGLTLLTNPEGRLQLPVREGETSLEMTAWTRDVLRRVGLPAPELSPAPEAFDAESARYSPVWSTYFAVLAGLPVPSDQRTAAEEAVAALAVAPDDRAAADVMMSMWAAQQAGLGDALPPAALAWARDQVQECHGNAYTLVHTVQALTATGEQEEPLVVALRGCLAESGAGVTAPQVPRHEEELLATVGEALAFDEVGWPADVPRDAYAAALAPQPWSWSDPWWSAFSLRGFVAAGGDPVAYAPVAREWVEHLDEDGTMPVLMIDQPNPEQDMFAAMIAHRVGVEWSGLPAQTLRATAADVAQWPDERHATWTLSAYLQGVELTQEESERSAEPVRRCAQDTVDLGSLRRHWVCELAADALGVDVADADVGPAFYRGLEPAAAVEAAAVLEPTDLPAEVRSAITTVASEPGRHGTQTVAQALLVARRFPGTLTDEAPLVDAIERARAEADLSGLYTTTPGDGVVDVYATYWVCAADAEEPAR